MKTLTLAALSPYAGRYAVRVYDGTTFSELGGATLTLAGDVLAYTPDASLPGGAAATATVTAVCQNTDMAGQPIGVVAVVDAQRHVDFFSPPFSGLYTSGTDLANPSGRYMQGTTPAAGAAPAPAPGAYSTYAAFAAAAPTTRAQAPNDALAWLAGTYYGRSSTGACSVSINANGSVSATLSGSTQTGALDGESKDTWVQLPSNAMNFGVVAAGGAQAVSLTGYAGRLVLVELAGVLDKCAIAVKSVAPLSMDLASTPPLPVKSTGLAAGDLPGWLVGSRSGQVAGTLLYPQGGTASCTLSVGADGTARLDAGGRVYTAVFDGGTGNATSGNRDASTASRASAYAALTGASGWAWTATAQSASGSDTVQLDIELVHTAERSQVSYVTAQTKTTATGVTRQLDACYFPN